MIHANKMTTPQPGNSAIVGQPAEARRCSRTAAVFAQSKGAGGASPKQEGANQTDLRLNGLSRDSGGQSQVGHEYRDSSPSNDPAKAVILQQKVRIFLE